MSRTGYRKPGIRYPNGRLVPSGYVRSNRISQDDLDAGRYPEGDVRNKPAVRDWLDEHRGKFTLPQDLPTVWLGTREHCPTCGQLGH